MTRMIAIKSLVPVKQVAFRDESAVNIALTQVNCSLTIMLDMGNLFPSVFAQRAMEYKQLSMTEYHAATQEG